MSSHDIPPAKLGDDHDGRPWYRLLTRYHWFVFAVAVLGWTFDAMDQQLFNMNRQSAMTELLDPDMDAKAYAGYSTSIFIIGWAMGGLIFGILGDRYGRARMMILTILTYSVFTGLSATSQGFWDFALWRFLTGLGVGGEFAVGVALIAEVMPERARPHALGWLQALSTVGNISAALITKGVGFAHSENMLPEGLTPWRAMFLIGTFPALLAVVIRWRLKEPARWTAVATGDQVKERVGSLRALFEDPILRRNALIGLVLAIAGVIGLWGIAFFVFDFIKDLFGPRYGKDEAIQLIGNAGIMLNVGGFLGMYAVSRATDYMTRRRMFTLCFLLAIGTVILTFWMLNEVWHIYVLIPLMGFGIFSLFSSYAIYFPELFPTRLRSTGVSFCYNVGRFIAAIGPFTLGLLAGKLFKPYGDIMAWRYSGISMCVFLLIGLLAVPFAPETKDQPLPE